MGRGPDPGASQEDRKSLGSELRRRRQGSLLHAVHANGWIQENGVDRRSFRSESLAARRSYARTRSLRSERVQGREPGRADSPDCLGSADDALRPPRIAEATRCRGLQRREVAGQVKTSGLKQVRQAIHQLRRNWLSIGAAYPGRPVALLAIPG